MKKKTVSELGSVPGQNARDGLKTNRRYEGPLPDFTGQLRCETGDQDLGKDRIILIKPEQLAAKKVKYPRLQVIEVVS